MIKFVTNIGSFWEKELYSYQYKRTVPFVARNFDHLDKQYYSQGYILQSFNEELPIDHRKFLDVYGFTNGSVSWTCILPNSVLPTHKDTFYTMRLNHNIEIEKCFRYLLFLEDWIFGQYVGFDDQHIIKWKKGDTWVFDADELHFASNASNSLFHSAQISSFK